jgi:formylglycine-generating enzyme required for sulfatase activity
MPFDLVLIPLALQDNRVVELPGLSASQAPFRAARSRSGDTLVLHLALDGTAPLAGKEHQRLVKDLMETYFKTPGSATAGMRTVATQLNDLLIERNRRGASRSLQSAGLLTLAVFRENRLYLAQCGPTHTFLIQSSGITQYYLSNLAWRGLGFSRVPEIRYNRMEIASGDLLLITPDLPTAWKPDHWMQLVGQPLEAVTLGLLDQVGPALEAALVKAESGSGTLKILESETIQQLLLESGRSIGSKQQEVVSEPEVVPELQDSKESTQEDAMDVVHEADQVPPLENQAEAAQLSRERSTELFAGTSAETQSRKFQVEAGGLFSKISRWVVGLVGAILVVGVILSMLYMRGSGLPSFGEILPGFGNESVTPTSSSTSTPQPSLTPSATRTHAMIPPSPTEVPKTPTPEPTPPPTPLYRIGSTQVSTVDGMVMVFVPPGTFPMGALSTDDQAEGDESPQHNVNLDSFWIDQTEVTNGQYAQCMEARECRIPLSRTSFTRNPYLDVDEFNNYPVIFVSWQDAKAYCEWAGRRLPTEAEWEKAARGDAETLYPWGDDLDCSRANFIGCQGDTAGVFDYPDGTSPYGALNMAGNVWEWVADWYYRDYYEISPLEGPEGPDNATFRVIRGGSWLDEAASLRVSNRDWFFPENARYNVGFRCALSEPP